MNKDEFLQRMKQLREDDNKAYNEELAAGDKYAEDNCPIKKWDAVQSKKTGTRLLIDSVTATHEGINEFIFTGYVINKKNEIDLERNDFITSNTKTCDNLKIIGHQDISQDIKEIEEFNCFCNHKREKITKIDYDGD